MLSITINTIEKHVTTLNRTSDAISNKAIDMLQDSAKMVDEAVHYSDVLNHLKKYAK